MSIETIRLAAMAVAVGVGVLGPGIGIGLIGSKAVEAIGRNPETEGAVRSNAILYISFAESLAVFALVVGLIIRFVN
jgi:F-type H+-transporting ATPase subunit c